MGKECNNGIPIDERKSPHKWENSLLGFLQDINNYWKIPINWKLNLEELFGKTVYVVWVSKEEWPLCKKTFIQEVGNDDEWDYFKVNNKGAGAVIFFSEEEALKELEKIKKQYIEMLTTQYKEAVAEIQNRGSDFTDDPVIEKEWAAEILSAFTLDDDKKPAQYTEKLTPKFILGQPVFITRRPGEGIGLVNPEINYEFKISKTKVVGMSIEEYDKQVQIVYILENNEKIIPSRGNFNHFFSDIEEARKHITKLRDDFVGQYSWEIPLEEDLTKKEKYKKEIEKIKKTHHRDYIITKKEA